MNNSIIPCQYKKDNKKNLNLQILTNKNLKNFDKNILIYLCEHIDILYNTHNKDYLDFSYQKISEDLNTSKDSIIRSLKRLDEHNFIDKIRIGNKIKIYLRQNNFILVEKNTKIIKFDLYKNFPELRGKFSM